MTIRNLLQNCGTLLKECIQKEQRPVHNGVLQAVLLLVEAIHDRYIVEAEQSREGA